MALTHKIFIFTASLLVFGLIGIIGGANVTSIDQLIGRWNVLAIGVEPLFQNFTYKCPEIEITKSGEKTFNIRNITNVHENHAEPSSSGQLLNESLVSILLTEERNSTYYGVESFNNGSDLVFMNSGPAQSVVLDSRQTTPSQEALLRLKYLIMKNDLVLVKIDNSNCSRREILTIT